MQAQTRIGNRAGLLVCALVVLGGAAPAKAQDCLEWVLRAHSGPSSRMAHAMAYDAVRGVTVLTAGYDWATQTECHDTWEWDGITWTLRDGGSPARRLGHAMAFDVARKVTVLYGGWYWDGTWEGHYYDDTLARDGNAWAGLTSGVPLRRCDHAMAYDSAREVVVLVGGEVLPYYGHPRGSDDTWEWDGKTWSFRTYGWYPSACCGNAMAYDSARGMTVLNGGGETWEWNGDTWILQANSGPSPRTYHAMAYDAARAVVVLFGGMEHNPPPYYLGDTWEWDGTTWRLRTGSGPPAQGGHAMVYDSAREVIVLFGGSETWELRAARPKVLQPPASQTVVVGQPVEFTVLAQGTGTLTYQWRKNGVNLTDGGRISGATTATLTIDPAVRCDAGRYDVVITDNCGSVTSDTATLTVECANASLPVLLVSSKGTNSALAYNGTTGLFVLKIADASSGLSYPNGIVVDCADNLYVASVSSNSVIKYALKTGERLGEFSGGGLIAPDGLLLGDATLLVSSYATDNIKEFDLQTRLWIRDFVASGSGGLNGPSGLIQRSNGNLLVASQESNQVLEYDGQTGAFIRVAAEGGGLSLPFGLALDEVGNLLVASWSTNSVLKYAPNGTFLGEFVASGSGGLSGAGGLAWTPNGNLLVASRWTANVLEYARTNGSFVGVYASGGGLNEPTHIAVAVICDPDCNTNGVIDRWDIANGTSTDVNGNGIPDECESIGDLNCDGVVNFGDIDPFILAITSHAQYQQQYPNCNWLNADCNGDGHVDFDDIDPFVALLGG